MNMIVCLSQMAQMHFIDAIDREAVDSTMTLMN